MRLLLIDIETVPTLAYTWDIHNAFIPVEFIVKPSSVLCFSAQWYGEKEVLFYSIRKDGYNRMIREAHRLLSEADAIVHYNGNNFDIPILNREFLKLGLPPASPAHQLDLWQTVSRKFRMVSSKLAFVGPYLKIGEKVKHEGNDLWLGCMNNDPECWAKMETYNRQDTALLGGLYKKILPWIDHHPNVNLFHKDFDGNDVQCPKCGSKNVQWAGTRKAVTYTYKRYQCNDCGSWGRARMSEKTAPKPKVVPL
jgi:DNA polymerase elongation subunit (family B)